MVDGYASVGNSDGPVLLAPVVDVRLRVGGNRRCRQRCQRQCSRAYDLQNLLWIKRSREEEALSSLAAQLAENVDLVGLLDSFGDGLQFERVGEFDDRRHQRPAAACVLQR